MTSSPASTPQATSEPAHGHWPRAAASAVVFRDGPGGVREVLIIERGKGAMRGIWSLPGGHVEPGETVRDAACREILEETSVTMKLLGLVDIVDVIGHTPGGGISHHYILSAFYGVWADGEVMARSDAADARFVPLDQLAGYRLTDNTTRVIETAAELLTSRLEKA